MAKIVRARPTTSKTTDKLEHIAAALSVLAEEVKGLRHTPAPPSKMPRGTRDVAEQAAAAVVQAAPEPPKSLRDRIRGYLRENTLGYAELAKALDASPEEVTAEVRAAAKEGLVANVGTEDFPMFTWRIGDETSAAELTAMVRRLLSERPMTTNELTRATGARFTRVGGAIVAIQRSGEQVLDLNANGRAGRWFLVPASARDARLAPKSRK